MVVRTAGRMPSRPMTAAPCPVRAIVPAVLLFFALKAYLWAFVGETTVRESAKSWVLHRYFLAHQPDHIDRDNSRLFHLEQVNAIFSAHRW